METISQLLNFFLHLDNHLVTFVTSYGAWTYALLFMVIFCETGLVVIPFLPGDSLLFAAGALCATTNNVLDVNTLFILLVIASITGNALNYLIGRFVGPKVFCSEGSVFFSKKHLNRAHDFYQTYGGKTLIIARFMPVIRTFAPFVAGIAKMSYREFSFYNIISALLWIGSLLYLSYLFGNIPIVKENFSIVVLGIIGLSILPPIIEIIRRKYFQSES